MIAAVVREAKDRLPEQLVEKEALMNYLPNAPLLSGTSRETTEKESGNGLN